MELIDCGVSGSDEVTEVAWSDAALTPQWRAIARLLSGSDTARPIQWAAIHDHSLLESRRNLVVSSTTNSGKTLVGMLMLLESIASGGKVILIEPLRALAEEKAQQLREVQGKLSELLAVDIDIVVSTGNYRCRDEMMTDPPPNRGQFVIATPERVESIIRNPEHREWLSSITAVCLDEAHLISVSKRGLLIENVITTFNSQPSPPRIALLSATIANSEKLSAWLSPCDVICDSVRTPSLSKRIAKLEGDDVADEVIAEFVEQTLVDSAKSLTVFVYQTRSKKGRC